MGESIIQDRKLDLCPSTADMPVSDLIRECPSCGIFLLYCCKCHNHNLDLPKHRRRTRPCHYYRIVFTDGACINNGNASAKAGVGVAYGTSDGSQMSLPMTDTEDSFPLRSNQRAELYAAKVGLEFLAESARVNTEEPVGKSKDEPAYWIIATDSEYVVKGMTEWLPRWKVCASLLPSQTNPDRARRTMTGARQKALDRRIWTCFLLSMTRRRIMRTIMLRLVILYSRNGFKLEMRLMMCRLRSGGYQGSTTHLPIVLQNRRLSTGIWLTVLLTTGR
jgi:ribonuclease HI